ncbi:MAG TPA: hypothetical protein VJM53_10540 [Burkholderiales bacterium]|nr:hypothetical protein [Burkholderiales bacterium]
MPRTFMQRIERNKALSVQTHPLARQMTVHYPFLRPSLGHA